MSITVYEYKREQALIARRQAEDLREMHLTANCGLDLQMNYGTMYVPPHIVMRVADQFPIWAAEYESVADRLEAEMAAMLVPADQDAP